MYYWVSMGYRVSLNFARARKKIIYLKFIFRKKVSKSIKNTEFLYFWDIGSIWCRLICMRAKNFIFSEFYFF